MHQGVRAPAQPGGRRPPGLGLGQRPGGSLHAVGAGHHGGSGPAGLRVRPKRQPNSEGGGARGTAHWPARHATPAQAPQPSTPIGAPVLCLQAAGAAA